MDYKLDAYDFAPFLDFSTMLGYASDGTFGGKDQQFVARFAEKYASEGDDMLLNNLDAKILWEMAGHGVKALSSTREQAIQCIRSARG
jgi:hypothetical protein